MAATNLYVRKTGSAANGGSSTSASPDATGADGVANGTTTFTAASGTFAPGDVDKLINIVGKGRYRIVARASNTSITLSGSPSAGSSLTWNMGGACLNIGDLLAAVASTLVNGDAIWIGAGTYREIVTLTNANTAEVTVNGDVDGAKTGDAGMVQWSGFTTNDKTAASGTTLITFNGKDFLTFKNIMFQSSNTTMITATTATSTDVKFTDCAFVAHPTSIASTITVTAAFATALNWTFDRCLFIFNNNNLFVITLTTGAGADYDANFLVQNCVFVAGLGKIFSVANSGTLANKGGGVKMRNCFSIGPTCISTVASQNSTTIPCTINNSVFCSVGNGGSVLNAGTSGQITEDYNIINATTPRTNVTAGTHSISDGSYATLFHFGQERIWGGLLRSFGEPMLSSPLLAFGNDGNQTAYDNRNNPRPAGGLSTSPATGAMDRANAFGKEIGTVHTGSNAISITGPGYQDFLIPVDAVSTTIGIYGRYDATYAGTRPQIQLLTNGECGVTGSTVTFTVGALGAWEQQTIIFTPSAKGVVTLRVISNDTNGGGKAFFDSFSVA